MESVQSTTRGTAEAAKELGVSRNTLLRWFREGRISEVARDRNGWRIFSQEDLASIRRSLEPSISQPTSTGLVPESRKLMHQYLSKVPCFANLEVSVLEQLAEAARFLGCLKGQQLFRPSDPVLGVYIVVKGEIRVFRSNLEGREQTLAVVRPFETLGESVLFSKNARHINYAICLSSATVLILPTIQLKLLTQISPALAQAFLVEFSSRIQSLEERLEEQTLLSLDQRLVRLPLAQDNPMTATQMASFLGVARESVSRCLNRLLTLGGLERSQDSKFCVTDRQALASSL